VADRILRPFEAMSGLVDLRMRISSRGGTPWPACDGFRRAQDRSTSCEARFAHFPLRSGWQSGI